MLIVQFHIIKDRRKQQKKKKNLEEHPKIFSIRMPGA